MRRHYKTLGGAVVCAGVVIILALILPSSAWWFALGVTLVIGGIHLLRCGI